LFVDLRFGFNKAEGVSLDLIYTVGSGSDDRELSGGRSSAIGGGAPLHMVTRAADRWRVAPPALRCSTRDGKKLNPTKMTRQTSPWVDLGSGGSD
jgi:hypothetical protein